jgi:CheY-like chemotaxis protein
MGVTPAPSGGALFWIELPSGVDDGSEESTDVVRVSERLKVLAVDDELRVLAALCGLLEPQHDVSASNKPIDALELAIGQDPDVILCDVMMPQMSATDFVERLREKAPQLVSRVVLMTAGAFTPEERVAVDRGTHLTLRKPFTRDELETVLARSVRESPRSTAERRRRPDGDKPMRRGLNFVKVFSATKARDRDALGNRVTEWLEAHPGVTVVETIVRLSSDRAFHCLTIVLLGNERV